MSSIELSPSLVVKLKRTHFFVLHVLVLQDRECHLAFLFFNGGSKHGCLGCIEFKCMKSDFHTRTRNILKRNKVIFFSFKTNQAQCVLRKRVVLFLILRSNFLTLLKCSTRLAHMTPFFTLRKNKHHFCFFRRQTNWVVLMNYKSPSYQLK